MLIVGIVFLLGGLAMIACVPLKISNQVSEGKKYSGYVYAEGEVINQNWTSSTTNHDNDDTYYDIQADIQYEADGMKYVVTEKITNHKFTSISTKQDIIYNGDNPSEACLASYDVIAKRYLPDGCSSWASYLLLFVVLIAMGIVCTGVGLMLVFS